MKENPFGWGYYIRKRDFVEDGDKYTYHLFWDKDNKLFLNGTEKTLCGKIHLNKLGDHDYSDLDTIEKFKEAVHAPYNAPYICKSCLKVFDKKYKLFLTRKKIIELLRQHGELTTAQIADQLYVKSPYRHGGHYARTVGKILKNMPEVRYRYREDGKIKLWRLAK